jgi:NAD(P)-dependent dehydrogenase (short-subunit alcohol dehydrogenase family)
MPIMIAQDTPCHVVNTASVAGLSALGASASYTVTKYGIVGLSETLYQELARADAKVRVSVLCPALVSTRLLNAERNRPPDSDDETPHRPLTTEELEERWELGDQRWAFLGPRLSPEQVAELVFQAIREEQFYVLTQKEITKLLRRRTADIIRGRNPEVL